MLNNAPPWARKGGKSLIESSTLSNRSTSSRSFTSNNYKAMENRKLRLVLVEPNGSGGLIHYTYQLCTALANEGVDVTLITGKEYELAHLPHNFQVNNLLDLWSLFDPQVG